MHHNVPLDKKLGVDPSKLLKIELLQSGDEGKNVEFFQKEVESVCAMPSKHRTERETKAFELFNAIQNSKTQVNSSITEPSAWEEICDSALAKRDTKINNQKIVVSSTLEDKIHSGWIGKCVGCFLGKPVEGWTRKKILNFTKNYY